MGHEYDHKVLHVHIHPSYMPYLLTKLMNLKHQYGLSGVKLKKLYYGLEVERWVSMENL
jgi:hypothetical protein